MNQERGMKLKTWEMIKELTENPNKEFVRKVDGLHIKTNEDGELIWDNGYQFMRLNHEWEEIKKPVDFMTAIQSEKPMQEILLNIANKLGKYEDIGLEPHEIQTLLGRLEKYEWKYGSAERAMDYAEYAGNI